MFNQLVLNSSRARSFAETKWGRGGTRSYRTNRAGAYYFSCAGHGGYIVDAFALSQEERDKINEYVKPEDVLAIVKPNGDVFYVSNPYTARTRRISYSRLYTLGEHQIYYFEEDCDWAVLEALTHVRCVGSPSKEEAQRVFEHWHGSKKSA